MQKFASEWDNSMNSQGQFPMQSLHLAAQELKSGCYENRTYLRARELFTTLNTRCALDGVTSPTGTGTPVSTPLSNGEDPLFGSIDRTLTEPVMGQLGAGGVSRNGGGRGRSGESKCLRS